MKLILISGLIHLAEGTTIVQSVLNALVEDPWIPASQFADPYRRQIASRALFYLSVPLWFHEGLFALTSLSHDSEPVRRFGDMYGQLIYPESAYSVAVSWTLNCVKPLKESTGTDVPCSFERSRMVLSHTQRKVVGALLVRGNGYMHHIPAVVSRDRSPQLAGLLLCQDPYLCLDSVIDAVSLMEPSSHLDRNSVKRIQQVTQLFIQMPLYVHEGLEILAIGETVNIATPMARLSSNMSELDPLQIRPLVSEWMRVCVEPLILWRMNPVGLPPCKPDASGRLMVLTDPRPALDFLYAYLLSKI